MNNNFSETRFGNVVTSHGNVFRAVADVNGKEFRLEMDLEKTWLHVIDADSKCEGFSIEENQVESTDGEVVTEDWSDADFNALSELIAAAK